MPALLLIVGPPSVNSDTLQNNRAWGRETSLPNFVRRLAKCWIGDFCWCNNLQLDYWFSRDPQVDVVSRCVFSVQKIDLSSSKKAVLFWLDLFVSKQIKQLGILPGGLGLGGFDCKHLHRLSLWVSAWTPYSFNGKNFITLNHFF